MSYVVTDRAQPLADVKDDLLKFGFEALLYLPEALKVIKEHGPKIAGAIKEYGPQAIKAIQTYGPQAIALIKQYGPQAISMIQQYGPKAFETGQQLATSMTKTADFFEKYKWPLVVGGGGLALLLVLNVAKR